jgi:hypothetical protein
MYVTLSGYCITDFQCPTACISKLPARFEPLTGPGSCCATVARQNVCHIIHTATLSDPAVPMPDYGEWRVCPSLLEGTPPPSVAACVSRNDKEMTSVRSAGDNIWSGKESAVACRDWREQYVLCKTE